MKLITNGLSCSYRTFCIRCTYVTTSRLGCTTHRAYEGGSESHLQCDCDVDDVLVVLDDLVDAAVLVAAVLAVPPPAVLVVVVVEARVEVHVPEQRVAGDVQVADRGA